MYHGRLARVLFGNKEHGHDTRDTKIRRIGWFLRVSLV